MRAESSDEGHRSVGCGGDGWLGRVRSGPMHIRTVWAGRYQDRGGLRWGRAPVGGPASAPCRADVTPGVRAGRHPDPISPAAPTGGHWSPGPWGGPVAAWRVGCAWYQRATWISTDTCWGTGLAPRTGAWCLSGPRRPPALSVPISWMDGPRGLARRTGARASGQREGGVTVEVAGRIHVERGLADGWSGLRGPEPASVAIGTEHPGSEGAAGSRALPRSEPAHGARVAAQMRLPRTRRPAEAAG